jgi:hypothetical protein
MTDKRIQRLYDGVPITCTAEEWLGGLRSEVHKFAGKMVDHGQDVRAQIALEEVRRLDAIHGSGLEIR